MSKSCFVKLYLRGFREEKNALRDLEHWSLGTWDLRTLVAWNFETLDSEFKKK